MDRTRVPLLEWFADAATDYSTPSRGGTQRNDVLFHVYDFRTGWYVGVSWGTEDDDPAESQICGLVLGPAGEILARGIAASFGLGCTIAEDPIVPETGDRGYGRYYDPESNAWLAMVWQRLSNGQAPADWPADFKAWIARWHAPDQAIVVIRAGFAKDGRIIIGWEGHSNEGPIEVGPETWPDPVVPAHCLVRFLAAKTL